MREILHPIPNVSSTDHLQMGHSVFVFLKIFSGMAQRRYMRFNVKEERSKDMVHAFVIFFSSLK